MTPEEKAFLLFAVIKVVVVFTVLLVGGRATDAHGAESRRVDAESARP